ncbi:hypothetical protein NEH83_36850 [Streptomyces sp. JUS-F4]|uniref:hypothetical protein n=2 Tax=Streptomyces TaxID=1883 RepID=UPI0026664DF4|nr:hypothetical protein [Streptomyces sp. JUS-F4]WKN12759.1 hypothetical protein NEH83_00210 [Streptomyces sp. JUS-F4]WKN19267.1 hypothetical protein NEH83_36850 [Streptomyces sp. JUS-F4]
MEQGLSTTVSGMTNWTNSGSLSDLLTISDVPLQPDPPQKGGALKVTISGRLNTLPGEGATGRVLVKYGFITLSNTTPKWSELLAGEPDPTEPGPVSLVFPVSLDAQRTERQVHAHRLRDRRGRPPGRLRRPRSRPVGRR